MVLSVLTFRSAAAGLILLPALYVLGFTLIFSLALAELVSRFPRGSRRWPAAGRSALSSLFLVLGLIQFHNLRFPVNRRTFLMKRNAANRPPPSCPDQ